MTMVKRGATLLVCLLSLVCVACGTQGPADTKLNDSTLAPLTEQDYRLGPADELKITVFNEPDLSGEFVVNPGGSIAFPLVGEVAAQGKTVPEFSEYLSSILQKGYVRQPRVSIDVLNYRPFFILGEVGKPGTYPYSAGLTVMNAVATAGGFSYRADTRKVFIKHANEVAEKPYALTSATIVQPGDTVRIPERRF